MKQVRDERFVCLYGLFVEDYPELAYIEDEIKHTRKGDYSIVNWVMDEMDKSGVCKDYADEYNEYNQPTYMQKIKSADGEYILYYDGDGTVEIWGSEYPTKNIVSDSRKIKDENEVLNKLQSNLSEADRFLESPISSRYNCVVVSNDANLTWVVYKNNVRVCDFNINHVDEFTKEEAIGAADFYTTGIKDKHPEIEFVVMKKIDFVRKVKDILTDMLDFYLSNTSVSDSKKIKDADETQDVLDGILMIAFNDGSEEEGYNEVKKHANEQGELEGVQYETYDVDNQDGVTLIDLCAATDDANAFVKALLTEWGIIDAVADIEFEKSELMENAEVSDSRKIKDDSFNVNEFCDECVRLGNEYGFESSKEWITKDCCLLNYEIRLDDDVDEPDWFKHLIQLKLHLVKYGRGKGVGYYVDLEGFIDFIDRKLEQYSNVPKPKAQKLVSVFTPLADELKKLTRGIIEGRVSDSKVEDMTKPSHLRGYAEKYRKKRREQKESYKENEEETQDKEVTDSRRIKDYVVGTKHPQEYFVELRWMLESLKKRGYIDAYLDDDIIKGFAEYYDYPSLREFNEWGDEEVAAGFNEYIGTIEL